MLGRLQMSTVEALETYASIAGAIFSTDNKNGRFKDGMFKAITLENNVKCVVAKKLHGQQVKADHVRGDVGNDLMLAGNEDEAMGKTFVCAMPAVSMAYPRRFRTYRARKFRSANCAIWEAARATTAAPTFFKRIYIGEPGQIKEEFIDPGLGCNNPVTEVMDEARLVFGDHREIGCILSIGTGHPGPIALDKPRGFQKMLPTQLINVLKEIATDCESTAAMVARRFRNHPDVYFRLNVAHGAGSIALDEWEKMGQVISHTRAYMQEISVSRSLDSIVEYLTHSRGSGVTLVQVMC